MKRKSSISLILITLVLVGCSLGSKASTAVIPVDLTGEVTISNGDFDLTIYQIAEIESKDLGGRRISLRDSARETHNLYEIRIRYTNLTNEEDRLSYRQLWISLPEVEDPGNSLTVVGYCEPKAEHPTGAPTFCAYIPPAPAPGVFGIVGVIQATSWSIQPDEQAELYFFVILEKAQTEIEISFVEPE